MSKFLTVNKEMDGGEINHLLSPVQEAYWGRSKELKQAEQLFNKLLGMIRKDYLVKNTYDHFEINKWHKATETLLVSSKGKKTLADIEKCFQKQFGFDAMHLVFNREFSVLGPNAMAPVNCCVIRKLRTPGMFNFTPLKQSSGGYYDKSHSWICTVLLSTSLFDVRDITGGELVGLILHEVGHNFQCTPLANIELFMPFLSLYTDLKKASSSVFSRIAGVLALAIAGSFTNEVFNKIGQAINDFIADLSPETRELIDGFEKFILGASAFYSQLMKFSDPYDKISDFTTNVRELITCGPLKAAEILCGYSDEVFSDSFATAYGYGPELSSALVKMNINTDYDYNFLLNEAYPLHVIYDLSLTTCEIIDNVLNLDPHPSAQKRILNVLNKLEREANSSELPPDVKKVILDDIKRQTKMYKEYLNAEDGENKFTVLAMWRIFNDKLGGNLDIKALINKVFNLGKTEA